MRTSMHGALVTDHNTQEIFGFQYVPLKTMDKLVYGSSHMATLHFDQGLKLLGEIFDTVIAAQATRGSGVDTPVHVTLTPQKAGRCLEIQVRGLLGESVVLNPQPSTLNPQPSFKRGGCWGNR